MLIHPKIKKNKVGILLFKILQIKLKILNKLIQKMICSFYLKFMIILNKFPPIIFLNYLHNLSLNKKFSLINNIHKKTEILIMVYYSPMSNLIKILDGDCLSLPIKNSSLNSVLENNKVLIKANIGGFL